MVEFAPENAEGGDEKDDLVKPRSATFFLAKVS